MNWKSPSRRGESIWKNNTETSPSLMKDMTINIQEAQYTPSQRSSKWPTSRHTIVKLLDDKGKILKEAREKWFITYDRTSIRLLADFSLEALEAKGSLAGWNERTLVSYPNLHGAIKDRIKVHTWIIIKASIVTTACNSTFCFLHC